MWWLLLLVGLVLIVLFNQTIVLIAGMACVSVGIAKKMYKVIA